MEGLLSSLPAATQQGLAPAAMAAGEREGESGGAKNARGAGQGKGMAAVVGEDEGEGEASARLAVLEDELVRRQEDLKAALENVDQVCATVCACVAYFEGYSKGEGG